MTSSVAQEIGQQLRQARETSGLSLHDVADRLKLSLRQLEAIEAGDFSRLPGATFVRGFIRNYARFLALDNAPLMALLDQVYPPQPVDRAEPAPAANPAARNPARFAWLLLPLALLGGYLWWQAQPARQAPAEGALAPMLHQAASASAASEPLPVEASAVAASIAPVLPASNVAAVAPAASAPLAKAAPVAKPVPAQPASAPAPAAGSKRLRLTASADAWVSVVDATGKRLVFGTLAAGSSQEVTGVPPLKLKIGNAPAMALSYEGAAVDLKDKTRGTTAKLELN